MLSPPDRLTDAEIHEICDLLGDDGEFKSLKLAKFESRLLAALLTVTGPLTPVFAQDAAYYDAIDGKRTSSAPQMVSLSMSRLKERLKPYMEITNAPGGGWQVDAESKKIMLSVLRDKTGEKSKVTQPTVIPKQLPRICIDDDGGLPIESDVPLPLGRQRRKWHLDRLKPNESFLMPCERSDEKRLKSNLNGAVSNFRKEMKTRGETHWAFTIRWVDDQYGRGIRVWRVK